MTLRSADPGDFRSVAYRPPSGVRWGLGAAIVAVAYFALVPLLGPLLVAIGVRGSEWAGLALEFAAYALVALFALLVSRTRGLRSMRADFGLEIRPVDLAIGVAVAILLEIVRVVTAAAVLPLFAKPPTSNVQLSHDPAVNGGLGVLAVVVAPIVEELITRGLVLRAVRNAILRRHPEASASPSRWAVIWSVAVSAVVFTALHLHEAPDAVTAVVLIVTILPMGVVNGVMAIRFGRLGPGIVTHATLNATALALALTVSH